MNLHDRDGINELIARASNRTVISAYVMSRARSFYDVFTL